jgi:uncharacterized membrane protein YccC
MTDPVVSGRPQRAWRRAWRTTGARPSWWKGLRNALAIAAPLGVGLAAGQPALGTAAGLGAYLVAFVDDQGGAFGPRLRAMSLAAVLCGVSFVIGGAASVSVWLAAGAVVVWTFGWGLLSNAGSRPGVIASMAATAVLLGTELRAPKGVTGFAMILAGGALVIVLTALSVPFARRRQLDGEVNAVYDAVTAVVAGAVTASAEANESARIRALGVIASARRTIADSPDRRGESAVRLARIRRAERFLKLAAQVRFDASRSTGRPMTEVAPGLADPPGTEELPGPPGSSGGWSVAELLSAVHEARRGPIDPRRERNDEPAIQRSSVWERLRPSLRPGAEGFAYACRFSVVTAVGLVLSIFSGVPHGGWVPLTSWRVLRPSYAVTITRAHQRVGGTIVGGLLAAGALLVVQQSAWQVAVLGAAAFVCFALRPMNYGFYVVFATVVVLMLTGIGQATDVWVAAVRVAATLVGAGLAVLGARFLFPRWTAARAAASVRAALAANRVYADSIAAAYRGDYDMAAVTSGRRLADAATAGAYSIGDQMQLEPRGTQWQIAQMRAAVALNLRLRDALVSLATRRTARQGGTPDLALALDEVVAELDRVLAEGSGSGFAAGELPELESVVASVESLCAAAVAADDSRA